MKPGPLAYVRAATTDAALQVLGEHGDEAKVLAGGQSLLPLLNMRFARPAVLVDLNGIAGLDTIRIVNEVVRVGALARQSAFAADPVIRERVPLAAECMPHVGHFVTRNRGTVGGSIAHADARGELPLALTVLGGKVTIRSPTGGFRNVLAETFFVTHFTSLLAPNELLAETLWPAARPGSGFAFEEFALRRGDYALGMAACALRMEEGRAADVRIGVGAVADRPLLLADLSGAVAGNAVDGELAREVGARAAASVDPADNVHASAAYQRHLTGRLVGRALMRAWERATAAGAAVGEGEA
jgi:CO/xanthine dehydrogenase FAD-binding subunit